MKAIIKRDCNFEKLTGFIRYFRKAGIRANIIAITRITRAGSFTCNPSIHPTGIRRASHKIILTLNSDPVIYIVRHYKASFANDISGCQFPVDRLTV